MALFTAIHTVIWSLVAFYLANTVFEITSGHCFNTNAPPMATGIFNIISDFAILVIPLAPIWKLHMPIKRKLMVAAIFATGIASVNTDFL